MSVAILLLALAAFSLSWYTLHFTRSKIVAKRLGQDPGILNFKLAASKKDFVGNGHIIVREGYKQSKDEKYVVQTQDMERLILPPKYLSELRMLPETKLSHSVALVERHLGYYSGVDIILQDKQHSDVCRLQLTQNLPNLVPQMAEELAYSMEKFLSTASTSTTEASNQDISRVVTYPYIYSMVLGVSSRVFVGVALARDSRWLDVVSSYLATVVGTANALRPWPRGLREIVRPFLAPKRKMDTILADALKILAPAIEERQKMHGNQSDLLGFLVQTSEVVDPMSICLKLLVLISAALHTSTMAAVHTIYDLCERPEYLKDLKTEVRSALKERGGAWEFQTMKDLPLLDSFMKESMRCNQPDALAFNRIAMTPIKLSDGFLIPKGTFINMAAEGMSEDPEYYENPKRFDGYRFLNKPNFKETQPLNEFTGIEPGNLAWGSGRLTCPGRWYASAMNKLIVGSLLADFDISFPDGQNSRPKNLYSNGGVMPDPTQQILLRKMS